MDLPALLSSIDWPDLIIGAVLSALVSLIIWLAGIRRRRRQRYDGAMEGWVPATRIIELALFKPNATAWSVREAWHGFPIDRWRSILGPEGFTLLERAEGAMQQREYMERNSLPSTDARAAEANAKAAFANYRRALSRDEYTANVRREERQRVRRDYLKHPLRTWKRERHNARMRREAGMTGKPL